MRKIFAFEEDDSSEEDNTLLIDKLLDRKEQEDKPVSLTADLLKQRDKIVKEVEEEINSEDEKEEDGSENTGEEGSGEGEVGDTEGEEGDGEGDEEEEEQDEELEMETSKGAKDKEKKDKEEAEGAEADSEEDLDNIVGSELGGKKEKTATESYSIKKPKRKLKKKVPLSDVFDPIKSSYNKYRISLEDFQTNQKPVEEEDQPVAYIKESILKSISNLSNIAKKYSESNITSINKLSSSIKELHEKLTVFAELVKAKKYEFTDKLVSDRDILSNVGYTGESGVRETSRAMYNYINISSKLSSLIMNNTFDQLEQAFAAQGFVREGDDLIYKKPVPGFNSVRVSLVPYQNYLKTNMTEYQYYKLSVMKTEDLYELTSIDITEDNDIAYLVDILVKLMLSLSIGIDTLSKVNEHFSKFVDDLKIIAYNVQNDEYKNLSELGLDEKVKDFIRYKLVMELYYVNIDMLFSYITSMISVINITVKLEN